MINVLNCGHNSRHKKTCDILHPAGLNDYLFLLVKQYSWYYDSDGKRAVAPNSVLLFPPHTPIHYGCDTDDYNDDWIHFDLTEADTDILGTFHFPYGTILQPRDFRRLSDYARLISDEFHSDRIHREEIIDRLMHIFMCALHEELIRTEEQSTVMPKYYREFASIRTQIYNAPAADWTVNQLADTLCLSCSHFQHLYKRFFGCSCQHDIILARIALARFYLTSTDMSIYQLSLFCGYETDLHFMRQFKKHTGTTPSAYRRQTRCTDK